MGEASWDWLSILAGAHGLLPPHLTVTLHLMSPTDTCSWKFHHFGLDEVSLPAACSGWRHQRRGRHCSRTGDSHLALGMGAGESGKKVVRMETDVLALL